MLNRHSSTPPNLQLKVNSPNSSTIEPAGIEQRHHRFCSSGSSALRLTTRTHISIFVNHEKAPYFSRPLRKMPRFFPLRLDPPREIPKISPHSTIFRPFLPLNPLHQMGDTSDWGSPQPARRNQHHPRPHGAWPRPGERQNHEGRNHCSEFIQLPVILPSMILT